MGLIMNTVPLYLLLVSYGLTFKTLYLSCAFMGWAHTSEKGMDICGKMRYDGRRKRFGCT